MYKIKKYNEESTKHRQKRELYVCELPDPMMFSSPKFGAVEATSIGVLLNPLIDGHQIDIAIGDKAGTGNFHQFNFDGWAIYPYRIVNVDNVRKEVVGTYKSYLNEVTKCGSKNKGRLCSNLIGLSDLEKNLKENDDFKHIADSLMQKQEILAYDSYNKLQGIFEKDVNDILNVISFYSALYSIFPKENSPLGMTINDIRNHIAGQEDISCLFSFLKEHACLFEDEMFSPESRQAMRVFYEDLVKSTHS